jgi:AcrR family transcriptional regulator
LDAGRKLLPSTGIAGLSLRRVADEAGVNLGMFHYHFGSKEDFVRRVLTEVYEEFFEGLREEFAKPAARARPLERLRSMLEHLGQAAYSNRDLIAALVRDLLNNEKAALEFVAANVPRHAMLLLEVIRECRKKGVIHKSLKPEQTLGICIANLGLPAIAASFLERAALPNSLPLRAFPPESVRVRVEFLMRGLQA